MAPTKGQIDTATAQLRAEADFFAGEIQPSGALEPIYGIKIEFSGPGFRTRLEIKGERFAVEKLLADFHESFSNM